MNEKEMAEQKRIDENIGRIKNTIIVISGKGGVGKSTVSVNLAYGLALAGKQVGIMDVDIHGPSIAKMLGIEGKYPPKSEHSDFPAPIRVHDNLHAISIASFMQDQDSAIIWRGPLKMGIIKQFLQDIHWPELDYLIVDCPPGTGDEPLSVVQLLKNVTGSVIVSTPQDVALLDARKTISFSNKMNVDVIGIIENMNGFKCPSCGEVTKIFDGSGIEKAIVDFGIDLLGSIPIDPQIAMTGDKGRPYIYDFGKMSGAQEMKKIVDKVLDKLS